MELKNHNLTNTKYTEIIFEKRPCLDHDGSKIEGLFNAWIWLNNPSQFNSYTTAAVKEIILAFGEASNDRSVVAVIFTGVGDKAFCTGGNTKEYAEYYAGNPQEYSQYMRLFNDMVSAILKCEKPVICRVNGMRIGGGQEIGMACDFSISSDMARFGQAGPKHGSAPIGGATDFLPLFIGIERAMSSLTLCEPFSAHQAYYYGIINEIVPVLKVNGKYIPNPLVVTDKVTDSFGKVVFGSSKTGDDLKSGKELLASAEVDLSLLDRSVNMLAAKLLHTFPNCTTKTISEVRKFKLEHWDKNKESSREWLALNMMTEAKAGFRAFNFGTKDNREVDFIKLRQLLAEGAEWNDQLHEIISPQFKKEN
ncbi:6-oxocyclohex-1-ene-1-carbonyl-CoA hydratase [Ignavibacteria bacterium CHB1]|nr:MAG: 6-oxocyclohex-1-ene-1-carbonyl-CoA hydratase [Chlorobiota bacterium]MBV6398410.1 6-oxocyclohex-1-ene-1-carbonyl-CoA hydrolase [Ignavibacteria bacterium]MCC6885998.1 6-oxocyclohex-1-ene-1-carbonyl-CoA hydratase [Ignavibacteriales bacterium]MCE7952752.1 6-oxocyclohex-1-ene-1-carbonyl-CoA hydratase [Chlorobi bacterium CHB7]MDL1886862.1 6-oxocyclohex-1-ene-1-carbonyl-CoA hydratase [Ignavibacteria bacterium CHB1]RIK50385.1 MAG: 6-oxocyclohex-1-ene-1-carbonyl-CoA hydratase [Ignavibacteriota 